MPPRRQNRIALFSILALTPAVGLGVAVVNARNTVPDVPATVDAGVRTAAIQAKADRLPSPDISKLKVGLDALAARDIAAADSVRDSLPPTVLDRHILTWAIALKGGDAVPSGEIADAARQLSGWPGIAALRANSERALAREKPDAATVVRIFGTSEPQTVAGVTLLARAHVELGDVEAARQVLAPFWRAEKLDAKDEAAIIAEFGDIIPAADHRHRMERMLYADRTNAAQRVASLAGAKELADAWGAVVRSDKNAKKLLDAVPQEQRGAGYLFAKTKYLRKQNKFADAAAVMLKAPTDAAALVDADAWWIERRVLSRELLDADDAKTAYRIAAEHSAESSVNAADAEFHAGWYALRYLGDPKRAAGHFSRIAELAGGPISLSRAYYWLGRTAEAGGSGGAKAWFEKASAYGTTFYGQLAAERIGKKAIRIDSPLASAADRATFGGREVVQAIGRLEEAGYARYADALYLALADQLTSPGEIALLADMAGRRENHFLALKIAKAATARGIDIGALSHPIGAIPDSAEITGAGKALAYAVARQESEFNVGAVSGAGARGLLQLMPGTAKGLAEQAGLPYSQTRLTTDAGYNATLGAAFLQAQLGRFEGSYILTFAGYNAGPRRAAQWVARYGDPRGKDIDTVVDWIERLPYAETRGYIQRVTENYQVYKMRLTGSFDIVGDLVDGRTTH